MPRGQPNREALKGDENPATDVGETILIPNTRTRQGVLRNGTAVKVRSGAHIEGYNALDEMEDESDASSSGAEWDGGDDDDVDDHVVDEEDEEDADMSDDGSSIAGEEEAAAANVTHPRGSLVVALRYSKPDDTRVTHVNVYEESPKAIVSDLKQSSSATLLAPNHETMGSGLRAMELPNEKQKDFAMTLPEDSIKPSLSQTPSEGLNLAPKQFSQQPQINDES